MPKTAKKPATFKFKPFSDQQKRLIHWWRPGLKSAENRYIIADGSIRSGKTIACIIGFLTWSQEMYSGESFILAGKTMGALKKNVIRPMLQMFEAWGWPYNYVRSGSEPHIDVGTNTYFLYGADTEASQDKLQGLTAVGAYADEAALFPKSFIDQMIARCSKDDWKIWMNCNPAGPHHFIPEDFLQPEEAKKKKVYHLHFTMDDNLSLSRTRKEEYKNAWSHGSVFYKRFILGLWVAAEGLIYQHFVDHEKEYLIDPEWLNDNEIMYAVIGVDFGGTKSAHSFTLTGFTRGYKQVVILDEYYRKKRINPKQLQDDFIDFVKRAQTKYKVYEAYCDSKADTSRDWYFEDATVQTAIELTKDLMAKYNVPADHVIRHYDVTGKICPNPYVYNHTQYTWEDFKAALMGIEVKKSNGWVQATDGWMYYNGDTGLPVCNDWVKDENKWYWFNAAGIMVTNTWYHYNSAWYYLGPDGIMCTSQLVENSGKIYAVDADGKMITEPLMLRPEQDGALQYPGLVK